MLLKMLDFDATVSVMVHSLICEHCPLAKSNASLANSVVLFVKAQIVRMPDFARPALCVLTLLFDFSAIFIKGRMFHCLDQEKRFSVITCWRSSPITLFSDVVRFYETLTVFGAYALKEKNTFVLIEQPSELIAPERLRAS